MSKAAKGPAKRGRKDNDSDAGTDDPGTVGTFETLRDEAEHFVHVKLYEKAIESFTKALDMKPDDKTCLVIRSKCYLMLGNAEKALADAEAALSQDDDGKKDIRALNMKAEALYQKGDFENALVFYHRGNKLRPELQEFRLGIQKCEESIDNSIGDPAAVHLEAKGDLSSFYKQNENLQNKKKQQKGYTKVNQPKKEEKKERQRPQDSSKSKTTKELLGQLYQDKEFLEKLFDSLSNNGNKTDDFIKGRACDGLEYLNSRSDFWRQQKPMYARMRDQKKAGGKGSAGNQGGDGMKYVLAKLEEIDEAQAEGRYQDSLDKCKLTIKRVEKMPEESLKNKPSVLANLYSAMGNAYLEQGKYTQALDWHNKDLDLAKENHLDEAESRALDNLGRTHAKMGQYQEAVDIWKCKLPQSKTPLESTWLYHEIGRCYLELGNNKEAKEYGEKSLTSAQEADDAGWQLHARVLIAQSEVKCEELEAASDSFTLALELAEQQNDKAAQNAIKKALQDVNDKIVERDGQGDSEEDQQKTSEETKDSDHEKGDSEKEDRESPKGHDHKKEGKEEDSDTTKVDHSGPVKKDNSEKHNSKDETHISNEDKIIKTEEEEQKDANITDQAEGHKENV